MDEGLEEMWTESVKDIAEIDAGESDSFSVTTYSLYALVFTRWSVFGFARRVPLWGSVPLLYMLR